MSGPAGTNNLRIALICLSLAVFAACQDNAKGLYKYSAAIRGNLLIVDFDIGDKSTDDKAAIALNRSTSTVLNSSDSGIKFFLIPRNIQNEFKKGRMSFLVVPDGNMQGKKATLSVAQPTRRLLAEDQSPSPLYYASAGIRNSDSVSARPATIFERRMLWTFGDNNDANKDLEMYSIYANFTLTGALNLLMIWHLFTVIYWFVTIYLICINPFFEYARKSVRIFWIGQYAFYFQFISLFGALSTWFYSEFDLWMSLLTYAHTRFFGLDYTLFNTNTERLNRYDAYIGKLSATTTRPKSDGTAEQWNEDFYIIAAQLPQVIIYFIVTCLSLIPTKGIKDIFVSMRLGCTMCFGVHISYISMLSLFQFFMGTTSDGIDIASLIFAFIMIPIPILDVMIMKFQAIKLEDVSNFWTVPKAKGSFYFDIVGYTGHKKYRDYYPFFVGEAELILLMAMLIPATGTSSITQAVIMLVLILLTFVCAAVLPQFMKMKILNLIFYFMLFLFFIFVLVIDLSSQVSVDTAKGLTVWMELLHMTIMVWLLVTLVIRIIDLMMDAPTTYGETAKAIPPQKVKTTPKPSKI